MSISIGGEDAERLLEIVERYKSLRQITKELFEATRFPFMQIDSEYVNTRLAAITERTGCRDRDNMSPWLYDLEERLRKNREKERKATEKQIQSTLNSQQG